MAVGLGLALYFQPWVTRPTEVAVETMVLAPVSRVLAVNGRVAAVKTVELRPLVSGTLTDLLVAEGDVVVAGAELAQLDPGSQQAVVRQAKAGLDAALVAQDAAQAALARTRSLGATVSRTALEDAARNEQSAGQEVARMTALLDQAQLQLRNYTIRAPMGGTILALTPSPGQIVGTTTALLTIADMSDLVVETDVDEAYATQIRLNQTADLQLSGETEVRSGHVSFVSQQVDTASGGLAVKLAFDAPVTAPIGLTVTANIVVDSRAEALTVPRSALAATAAGTAVFVVAGEVAEQRLVTVIDWPATRLIVTKGLVPGDVVIVDAAGITEGQAVTAVKP